MLTLIELEPVTSILSSNGGYTRSKRRMGVRSRGEQ